MQVIYRITDIKYVRTTNPILT